MLRSLIFRNKCSKNNSNAITELVQKFTPIELSHHTNIARWHTDCRAPAHMVLIHGLYTSGNMFWSDFFRAVNDFPSIGKAPKRPTNMYAVDLQDHGKSPHSSAEFDVIQACASVAQFIQSPLCQGEAVYLVGHGIGGYIASIVALAYPSLCTGVASLNSSLFDVSEDVSSVTQWLVGAENAHNYTRSSHQSSAMAQDALSLLLKSKSPDEVDQGLKKFIEDPRERKVFMASAVRHKLDKKECEWKSNVAAVGTFDLHRKLNAVDAALRAKHSISSTVNHLRILDSNAAFERKESIENIFSKSTTHIWNGFGGKRAQASLALHEPAKVAHTVFEHFKLLENID